MNCPICNKSENEFIINKYLASAFECMHLIKNYNVVYTVIKLRKKSYHTTISDTKALEEFANPDVDFDQYRVILEGFVPLTAEKINKLFLLKN